MPPESTPKCCVLGKAAPQASCLEVTSGDGGTADFWRINPYPLGSCGAELPWSRFGGSATEELQGVHFDCNGAETILFGDAQTVDPALVAGLVGNRGEVEPINGPPALCRQPAWRAFPELLARLGVCGA